MLPRRSPRRLLLTRSSSSFSSSPASTWRHLTVVRDALFSAFGGGGESSSSSPQVFSFLPHEKIHDFQTDLVCRLPGYQRENVVDYVQTLQAHIMAAELSESNNLVDIHFPQDATVLTLCFGVPHVTTDLINGTPDDASRVLLRESLGCSEELYRQFLEDVILRATDLADITYRRRFHDDIMPPRHYLASLALRNLQANGVMNDFDIVTLIKRDLGRGREFAATTFDNPFCPGEDLHTIETVRRFITEAAYNPFYNMAQF